MVATISLLSQHYSQQPIRKKFNRPFFKLKEANWKQFIALTQQTNKKYHTSHNVNKNRSNQENYSL